MTEEQVEQVGRTFRHCAAPNATVIASHMYTVVHASLARKTLRAALGRRGIFGHILMPDDGEEYSL